tara:strand:- start:3452 stop:3631 length:180 start_codon:yes stop_codon:yes gene_type:complete
MVGRYDFANVEIKNWRNMEFLIIAPLVAMALICLFAQFVTGELDVVENEEECQEVEHVR